MNRSFVSALLSVTCFSTLPALSQMGSTQPDVILSAAGSPTASGVSLTGSVEPPMPVSPAPVPHPGGKLTFFDGGTALNAGGTAITADAAYRSATFAQTFGAPDAGLAAVAQGELAGDFDGDGKNDLIVYGTNNATRMELQVFLTSKPTGGNFRVLAPQTLTFSSLLGYSTPAVLDVDGDGKLDLLIGNTVAYGNGDGTFARVGVLLLLATGFNQTYGVDVNGDGKLDIVAVNTPPTPTNNPSTVQFVFTVFRNDGSGTFTSLGSFPLAPSFQTGVGPCCSIYDVFGLSFADLTGDGKVDVLSQSNFVPNVNCCQPISFNAMLNNGDGTFGTPKTIDASPDYPYIASAAFGDVNGDGKEDLVLAFADYAGTNFMGSALGSGDGTLGAFSQLKLINYLTLPFPNMDIQLVDLNGDGKLDAVLSSGQVALGNGDGTFSLGMPLFPQPANPQTPLTYPLLQADLLPYSWPSLVYLDLTSDANAAFTPQASSSANTTVALSAGTHTLTAQYSGDSTYTAGVSSPVTITVAPATTTTTVTSSANPSYTGESVTFTAAITGLTPGGAGTVTFSNGSTTLGTASVSKGSASFAAALTSAGSQTITAAYSGDANDAASSGTVTQTVDAPVAVGTGSGGSTSLTVAAGQSVTTQVSVTGAAGFGGMVNFSCTGLPQYATCSFAPASVTISGTAAATTTLTVSTSATTMASAREDESSSRTLAVLACGLPLLGLLTLLPMARSRRLLLCLGFALFVSMTSMTGCGGGSSQPETAAGTYSFNVVATSGSATSTAAYKLTVQ